VLIVFEGIDTDRPPYPEDNFSGDEPFWVDNLSMDPCGEPLHSFRHAVVDRGQLTAADGSVPVPIAAGLSSRGVSLSGAIEPDRRSASVTLCGPLLLEDLGSTSDLGLTGDLNLLEALLLGGAAFGAPAIPGLAPDLDLDEDGLEQFVTSEAGQIESCLDGDLTEIEGRECWQDERIADAISIVLELDAVPARFAGREPGWDGSVGPCDGGAPEASLFEPR
jgi:hypothetical protein